MLPPVAPHAASHWLGDGVESVVETTRQEQPGAGCHLHTREVRFGALTLTWGHYQCPRPQVVAVVPREPAVITHFRLRDSPGRPARAPGRLADQEFVCYREAATAYDLCLDPTSGGGRVFAELSLGPGLLPSLCPEDSPWAQRLVAAGPGERPVLNCRAAITPAMRGVLQELQTAPYQGYLRGLFLEAKAIELFLLQLAQLECPTPGRLSAADVRGIQEARAYLDAHYQRPGTILELARRVGLNQTKLKLGFRQLFATTVFGYVRTVRLQEARRLLIHEGLSVGEVAERIGFQQPHHFAAAFKKRFGALPSSLSRR